MFCSVILRGATKQIDRLFTYRVPDELSDTVSAGSLVSIPFGKGDSQRCAVVVELKDTFDGDDSVVKEIASVISGQPVLKPDQLALIDKISDRFNCTKSSLCLQLLMKISLRHSIRVNIRQLMKL